MRIAIYGAGGLGGYFGAKLAMAGEEVVFIARGEHLQVMQRDGLRIDSSIHDSFHLDTIHATSSASEAGRCDLILMAVKSWQLARAAKAARPMIGPHTLVVPMQNGVDAVPILIDALGERHVLAGLSRLISERAAPGHIHHFGISPYVAIGELNNQRSERAEKLALCFENAGIECEIPEDIYTALWEKFLLVGGWGSPAAVARAPLGPLRQLPESLAMIAAAMHEIADVARERGIPLPQDAVERCMASLEALPPEASTSFQRDIEAGRPSELEALCGAVVQLGREVGVPTPVNAFCHAALLPLEQRARGELNFSPP